MAALDLHCCMQAFSSCSVWGPFFIAMCRLLIAVVSVAEALGLSCPAACGIFPEQGSNQYLLHWQVDS